MARETAAVGFERSQREAAVLGRALSVLLAAPRVEVAADRAAWFDDIGPRSDPARAPALPPGQLDRVRCALGLNDPVHTGRRNPMIFFQAA